MRKRIHPLKKSNLVVDTTGSLLRVQSTLNANNTILNIDPTNHALWNTQKIILNLKDKSRASEFTRKFESIF